MNHSSISALSEIAKWGFNTHSPHPAPICHSAFTFSEENFHFFLSWFSQVLQKLADPWGFESQYFILLRQRYWSSFVPKCIPLSTCLLKRIISRQFHIKNIWGEGGGQEQLLPTPSHLNLFDALTLAYHCPLHDILTHCFNLFSYPSHTQGFHQTGKFCFFKKSEKSFLNVEYREIKKCHDFHLKNVYNKTYCKMLKIVWEIWSGEKSELFSDSW